MYNSSIHYPSVLQSVPASVPALDGPLDSALARVLDSSWVLSSLGSLWEP